MWDFRKNTLRIFDESLKEPTKAELWLFPIDTILRYMKCPEDQKMQCVIFVLTNTAQIWWQTAERMIRVGSRLVKWKKFKKRFYEKYFSTNLQHLKEKEFLHLE